MKEEKNIEQLFKMTFENFEVTPPSSVKFSIDRKIRKNKRNNRSFTILFLILCFASFITCNLNTIHTEYNTNQNITANLKVKNSKRFTSELEKLQNKKHCINKNKSVITSALYKNLFNKVNRSYTFLKQKDSIIPPYSSLNFDKYFSINTEKWKIKFTKKSNIEDELIKINQFEFTTNSNVLLPKNLDSIETIYKIQEINDSSKCERKHYFYSLFQVVLHLVHDKEVMGYQ